MRVFYLNLTYECNSNCVFCAAEHEIIGQCGSMNFQEIVDILELKELEEGDEVIINGGEPTLHRDLINVIKYINTKGAKVVLFTNGRKFKDGEFLKSIYELGLAQISIPIHGNEMVHDAITRVKGSYAETLAGLRNLKAIKQEHETDIELKVVLSQSNFGIIPQVVEQIVKLDVADRIGKKTI